MRIEVSGHHIDVGDALGAHIRARMEAEVAKYFDRAIEGAVLVSRSGHGYQVESSVHAGAGIVMRAAATADEPYAAADQAIDRIAKRLRRYKRRLKDHHKQNGGGVEAAAQSYVVAAEADDDVGEDHDEPAGHHPVVIAEEPTRILTMTPSAAVMALDLSEQPAVVFINAAHGAINVVYRRSDGNVGWIDPQIPGRTGGSSEQ
ncbi:MAG: ribosome hibernation-promoting factor, HPF/YfiA family [Alphaproteobacteria bacterium]